MLRKSSLRRATPLKRSRKRLKIRVRKRDLEWARAVKERDGFQCRRCKWASGIVGVEVHTIGGRGLHACHIFGRSKRSTRWDLVNGITLCMGHHIFYHSHPLEFVEFVKSELGYTQFNVLRQRAMGLDVPVSDHDGRRE